MLLVKNYELIQKCISGDRFAQKKLYDKHSPLLFALCKRYTKDEYLAYDVLHDGYIKIFTRIKTFRGTSEGEFVNWCKRIIINTAITSLSKTQYTDDIDDFEIESTESKEFDYKDIDTSYEHLLTLIQELPTRQQMIFNLYAIEGYIHKEIADILGITISTSKSQYCRARETLQRKLL